MSNHAKLRYLERIDAAEPHPAERVRETVATGEHAQVDRFDLPVRVGEDAAVLVDPSAGVAVTVIDAGDVSTASLGEPDASAGWRVERAHQGVGHGGHR